MTGYFEELRTNWRALAGAALGLGSGLSLNAYMGSVFAPHVMQEFGWTPSQYAMIGVGGLFLLLAIPVYGRLADIFGVRRVAAAGVIGYPLSFLLFSMTGPDFRVYFAIFCLQNLIAGSTTAAIYSRIVAQNFDKARGFAMGLAVTGPALVGAVASPLLTSFILAYGWRAGYQLAAVIFLVTGVIALLIIPRSIVNTQARKSPGSGIKRDYGRIVRSPAFWLLLLAMVLANLSHAVTASQLSVMLLDSHATIQTAGMLAACYAAGVIAGRIVCGVLLDRFPAHLVAGIAHILPAIGLFLLGSSLDQTIILALALILVGVAIGAEGDIAGFLIVRIFGIAIYGSVFGLIGAGVGLASASGSILLSKSIAATGNFALFLNANGFAVLVSVVLFLLIGRYMKADHSHETAGTELESEDETTGTTLSATPA